MPATNHSYCLSKCIAKVHPDIMSHNKSASTHIYDSRKSVNHRDFWFLIRWHGFPQKPDWDEFEQLCWIGGWVRVKISEVIFSSPNFPPSPSSFFPLFHYKWPRAHSLCNILVLLFSSDPWITWPYPTGIDRAPPFAHILRVILATIKPRHFLKWLL